MCRQIQIAGIAPPVKIGRDPLGRHDGVAEAPPASELPAAARWSITIPPGSMRGLSQLYLQMNYAGDVARFYSAHRLLTDNFNNGRPWTIGLTRFLDPQGAGNFTLSIFPLRGDAPVYFDLPRKPALPVHGQDAGLSSIHLVPEYQLTIDGGGH